MSTKILHISNSVICFRDQWELLAVNPGPCCYQNWGRIGPRGLDERKQTIVDGKHLVSPLWNYINFLAFSI